jgi:ATP-binding cassette subfamily B protein
LDSHSEAAIVEAMREVAAGRTTLVIAHRLSTIVDADKIIVLDNGSVAEQGSHNQLLELQGRYAQMWAMQLQAQQENSVFVQSY